MDFLNRVVLVTGASRGIGGAIAKAFASEGASVAVNYLQNTVAAEETLAACAEAGGDAAIGNEKEQVPICQGGGYIGDVLLQGIGNGGFSLAAFRWNDRSESTGPAP